MERSESNDTISIKIIIVMANILLLFALMAFAWVYLLDRSNADKLVWNLSISHPYIFFIAGSSSIIIIFAVITGFFINKLKKMNA